MTDANGKTCGECVDLYTSFLIAEYNNIAAAHFNCKNSILTFFKHYIWIMSIPLTAFLLNQKLSTTIGVEAIKHITSIAFLPAAIVGGLISLQIAALDATSVLYAKQVNGIRGYFNEKLMPDELDKADSILPNSISDPAVKKVPDLIQLGCYVINTSYLVSFCAMNTFLPLGLYSVLFIGILSLYGQMHLSYRLGAKKLAKYEKKTPR